MSLRAFLTPLNYLRLVDERGRRICFEDLLSTMGLTIVIAAPFLIFDDTNYFHKDGFLDKVGTFASVLTGFYVAGLLAVATFAATLGSLDNQIDVGSIILPASKADDVDLRLTRREYVCYIFGYLAFSSLAMTIAIITVVAVVTSLAPPAEHVFNVGRVTVHIAKKAPRCIGVIAWSFLLAHIGAVTCHGLYYLIERLYAKEPTTLPERRDSDADIDTDD